MQIFKNNLTIFQSDAYGPNQVIFTRIIQRQPTFLWKSVCNISKNISPLSASFTKWSNTLKQFVGNLPTNRLGVFDHFVGLALKRLGRSLFESFIKFFKHWKQAWRWLLLLLCSYYYEGTWVQMIFLMLFISVRLIVSFEFLFCDQLTSRRNTK